MIETLSLTLIVSGLAVLLVSYGRYFFSARRSKSAAKDESDARELIDPQTTLSNLSLSPEMMEQALHMSLSEVQPSQAHTAYIPAAEELDPLLDELLPEMSVQPDEQYIEEIREEMREEVYEEASQHANTGYIEHETPSAAPSTHYASDHEVVSLNVVAKPGRVLSGAALKGQFLGRGFEHGEMHIFHARFDGQTLFSVVNMAEPGSFDLGTMDGMVTPGVSFFLQLPGPQRDDIAFDMMLAEAHELSQALDAELRDEHQAPLTRNSLEETRARLIRSANARTESPVSYPEM